MPGTNEETTLAGILTGESATILGFKGGQAVNNRLASLGFTPGASVTMVQNFRSGPLIVTVRGTRVALGRGEASKITVQRG